jgi:thiamine biosynthesis lipoprotein ApbE
MDPRTGLPVQGVLSVVVITGDGLSGDALDNVFYVFGVERARASMKKFSASDVIFFLPDSLKKWKMVRVRRQNIASGNTAIQSLSGDQDKTTEEPI